jgi:hypothetical protein
MRVIVAGSQHWMDADKIRNELVNLPLGTTIVVGDMQGVETLVAKIAEDELSLEVEVWPIDYETDGNLALSRRNYKMTQTGADLCLVFLLKKDEPEWDCARKARGVGIDTVIIEQ